MKLMLFSNYLFENNLNFEPCHCLFRNYKVRTKLNLEVHIKVIFKLFVLKQFELCHFEPCHRLFRNYKVRNFRTKLSLEAHSKVILKLLLSLRTISFFDLFQRPLKNELKV
jgi:hypothetical protein